MEYFKIISKQTYPKSQIDLLLLEQEIIQKRALDNLSNSKEILSFFNVPNLPRTKALNFLIKKAKSNLNSWAR